MKEVRIIEIERDPSKLWWENNTACFRKAEIILKNNYLYFVTNEEEIVLGDWFYNKQLDSILPCLAPNLKSLLLGDYKKVIASSDPKLNLPEPTMSFVLKFSEDYKRGKIKNTCLVEVVVECNNCGELTICCPLEEKGYTYHSLKLTNNTINVDGLEERFYTLEQLQQVASCAWHEGTKVKFDVGVFLKWLRTEIVK